MGAQGDNDPVDVVEIGSVQCQQGSVYKVKPLGAYAMIDDGELDWKIVCIRTDDPLANVLNDIEDVERYVSSQSCYNKPGPVHVPQGLQPSRFLYYAHLKKLHEPIYNK